MKTDQLRALIPNGARMSEDAVVTLYAQLRELSSAIVAAFVAEREACGDLDTIAFFEFLNANAASDRAAGRGPRRPLEAGMPG